MKLEHDRSDMVKPLSVTMRAAVFCIDLNLFNRCLGRPYNKELQLSSLELSFQSVLREGNQHSVRLCKRWSLLEIVVVLQ